MFAVGDLQSQKPPDSLIGISGSLPLVELTGGRTFLAEQTKQSFDSTALNEGSVNNLADLLDRQSGVFVKSYGLGSLATLSLRGSSAGQVAVLWNGLPIENPMLGLSDVSLLDPVYFDAVTVSAGSQSSGYGSGAVAGALQLDSGRPGEQQLPQASVEFGAGSFGNTVQKIRCYFVSRNRKWRFQTRAVNRDAENDFSYFSPREEKRIRQLNARLTQRGIQQEVFFQPNEREYFSFRVWGQESEKEIPATTRQRRAESSQGDDFLRSSLHYRRQGDRTVFKLRSGLFRESIVFRDPNNGIRATSHFWKALLEGENEWYWPNDWQLTVGLGGQWLEGETAAYAEPQQQLRWSPFAAVRKSFGKLRTKLSIRQQLVNDRSLPVTPSLEMDWAANGWLSVNAALSRTYRLPTLNDLFWTPGGRPDLQAEHGWSQQLGLAAKAGKAVQWRTSLTAHHRLIDNWIQWAPLEGDPFWSANNLTRVRSYGLETNAGATYVSGKYTFSVKTAAEYVRSENQVAIDLPRMSAGEQLAYVPTWSGRAGLTIRNLTTSLRYQHQYVGERRGNSENSLAGYSLGSLVLNHRLTLKKRYRLDWSFNLENCWNREYRVLEFRRMPGRYWQTALRLTI